MDKQYDDKEIIAMLKKIDKKVSDLQKEVKNLDGLKGFFTSLGANVVADIAYGNLLNR